MKKGYHNIVGIDEIKGKPVRIKNSEFKTFSLDEHCSSNKTLRKKINEIKQFKQVGIFSSGLLINQKCVKSSFTDRHGKIHEGYWTGVWFPCSGYEHYIKTTAKGCGIPISKIISQKESFDRIELISGICLYGGNKFRLKTCKGNLISLTELNFQLNEPVDDIFVDESYSVYEAEAVTGLSSFINSLSQCNNNIETVHLEVPRGQYYLFLAEAYEKGYLSPDLFQRCIHEIDKRHEKIFRAYQKRLRVKNTKKAEPLSAIESYLTDSLENGKNICLTEAQDILKQDETWRKVLSVSPPEYWKELSYLSHIVTFLKIGKKEPNRAILQADDPIEEKILIKATRIIKKLGEKDKYKIWGVYPLQKVFLNPEYYPDSDLYYCPDIKLTFSILRKIILQSRYGCPKKNHPALNRIGACGDIFVPGRANKKDTGCLGSSCKQKARKCQRV